MYVERAHAIVDATRAAEAELRDGTEQPRGRLRVTMPPDFGRLFLTELFVEYANRFPEVAFELDLSPRVVDLVAEGFDVAIRVGAQRDSSLASRTISRIRAGIFASHEYVKQHGAPRTPEELSSHRCLVLIREGSPVRDWTLQSDGSTRRVRVTPRAAANNPNMLTRLARFGMGLALVDEVLAVDDLESGALVRVLAEWRAPPTLVSAVTSTKSIPKKSRLLIECLRDHLDRIRGRLARVDQGNVRR